MSVDYTKVFKLDHNFEQYEREDAYLYMDYTDVNWFRTNHTGKSLISACDGEKSLEQIISRYAEEMHFDPVIVKSFFGQYIEEAINCGVIYDVEDGAPSDVRIKNNPYEPMNKIGDLWIHVSSLCNLNCPFCYSKSGSENINTLDYKKVLHFLEDIKEEERDSVVISGGEPFLYQDLVPFVKGLHDMKYKQILIITNGTVGEEKYADVIPYVKGIQISVDGTEENIHDISRGQGSYNKMLKNMGVLRKLGLEKLVISFTPTIHNINDLPNLPKFAYHNDIDSIHITRYMPVGRGMDNIQDLSVGSENYQANMKEFIENFNKIEKLIEIENETEKKKRNLISLSYAGDQSYKVAYRIKKRNCGAGLGSMSIYHDGKIYPCASLHNPEFSFGSIQDSVAEVVQNAKAFMAEVTVDNLPKCRDCKFKYMCGGGCRACAYGCDSRRDIMVADPMCERYQKEMFELAWILEKPVIEEKADMSENPIGS